MGARRPKVDFVSLLEAAYAVDSPRWLEDILDAARRSLDHGLGVCAFSYDASRLGKLVIGDVIEVGAAAPVTTSGMAQGILHDVDASFVRATYRTKTCGTASEEPFFHEPFGARDYLAGHGIGDVQVVNALDATGRGFVLASYLPEMKRLTQKEREVWSRVAAHFSSANRLRRRMRSRARRGDSDARGEAGETADAVLTTKGGMEDGGADAVEARSVLRDAVLAYGRAKGTLRKDPDASVEAWRVLVDRRWTLLDRFDRDGAQYVIARRNDAPAKGPSALTKRERQVLSHVALGHENKMIGYILGVSHATVRVLVARAAAKLGARTREDLIAAYHAARDVEREAAGKDR